MCVFVITDLIKAIQSSLSLYISPVSCQVLILSQRGDWAGCDQALKGLEKSSDPELGPNPLKDVCDPVTGNTPLMYAAMENKHTTIERMIQLG